MNLSINFAIPWFLLFLIPATALTLWPYFKLSKKYRRTRNRITSIILHMLIMVLGISLLSGMTFVRQEVNTTNEVILLVDASYSNKASENRKNDFIKAVIAESKSEFKLGIVTFGYNQEYPVKLSNDTSTMFARYTNAARPDDSATDIAAALNYAKGCFSNPEKGKIILMTDGIETDGIAMSAARSIASDGVIVDTVYFPDVYADDVQIIGITVPDVSINVGEEITLGVTLQSMYEGSVTVTLFDDDQDDEPKKFTLNKGIETFDMVHTFTTGGLHSIHVEIESEGDTLKQNNIYYKHLYLEVFDRVLVLQREDEAYMLNLLLKERYGDEYADKVEIDQINNAPDTLDKLRQFDEVVLVNISNDDMPEQFDMLLNSYVKDCGGGLLTIGGDKVVNNATEANTYDRDDMGGTLYQAMLPVQAVNYTPPIAVMIVLDRSGSMSAPTSMGKTLMELAKDGAVTCVNALSDRDFCGVVSFSSGHKLEIGLTKIPEKNKIKDAIANIQPSGDTIYMQAIQTAAQALLAQDKVELKHIIFLTDGEPGDPPALFNEEITRYRETAGITMSVLTINATAQGAAIGMEMARRGGGGYAAVNNGNYSELSSLMRDFLKAPEITTVNYREFQPKIGKSDSPVFKDIKEIEIPKLHGFYGTRLKTGADNVLLGEFDVPIYAQWKYGEGKVGSFMCELTGSPNSWSRDFMKDKGLTLVWNIIRGLLPTESVRPREINARLRAQNYTTTVDIITPLESDESLSVTITERNLNGEAPRSENTKVTGADGFSRVTFNLKEIFGANIAGIYEIKIQKLDSNGNVKISAESGKPVEYTTYTSFSYSQEYNVFIDSEFQEQYIANLALSGKGNVIPANNAARVFEKISKTVQKTYDPRLLFMILAIVMFLLDVAVRKFKFKWPHEIVRDRKIKAELAQNKR